MISRFRLLWMLKWCDIQKALSLPTAQKSSTFQNGKALPVTEWGGQVDNEGGWSWGGFLVQPCDHVTVMKVFTKIVTPRSPSVTCNLWEVTTAAAMTANFLSLWPKFLQLGHKSALPTFPVQDDWENVEMAATRRLWFETKNNWWAYLVQSVKRKKSSALEPIFCQKPVL